MRRNGMSKPAIRERKSRPKCRPLRPRLSAAFWAKNHTTRTTQQRSSPCQSHPFARVDETPGRRRPIATARIRPYTTYALGEPLKRCRKLGSPERPCVLQPALVPQPVESTRQTEPLRAEMLLVDLAVVAGALHRPERPLVVQTDHLAEITFLAQEPAHERVVRGLRHLVGIRLGDAVLLGREQREVKPSGEGGPVLVALAGVDAERLLGNDLVDDVPVLGVLHRRARGGDTAAVIGVAVAAAGLGRGEGFLDPVEQERADLYVVRAGVAGDGEPEA